MSGRRFPYCSVKRCAGGYKHRGIDVPAAFPAYAARGQSALRTLRQQGPRITLGEARARCVLPAAPGAPGRCAQALTAGLAKRLGEDILPKLAGRLDRRSHLGETDGVVPQGEERRAHPVHLVLARRPAELRDDHARRGDGGWPALFSLPDGHR